MFECVPEGCRAPALDCSVPPAITEKLLANIPQFTMAKISSMNNSRPADCCSRRRLAQCGASGRAACQRDGPGDAPRFVTDVARPVGVTRTLCPTALVGKLPGRSLLTSLGPLGLLPITNCTELFPCPINTWGLLTDGRKLAAQSWDGNWRCLSLLAEERERGLAECSDLVKAACGIFPRLPNGNVSGNCAN